MTLEAFTQHFWLALAFGSGYLGWLGSQYLKRYYRPKGKRLPAACLHLFGSGMTFVMALYCLRQQFPLAPYDQVAFGAGCLAIAQATGVEAFFRWAKKNQPQVASALSGQLYTDAADRTIVHSLAATLVGAKVHPERRNMKRMPDDGDVSTPESEAKTQPREE